MKQARRRRRRADVSLGHRIRKIERLEASGMMASTFFGCISTEIYMVKSSYIIVTETRDFTFYLGLEFRTRFS